MSDEKWSVQPIKATPISADTTLIIDSVDNVSKQTTLGAIADLAVQTPWATDIDGNQFKLSNTPLIEMAFDGQVDLEMYRNTNPGVTGTAAKIDFDARKDSGSKSTFARIQHVINDVTVGTVSSELQFQARQADSLTVFMTVNDQNANRVRFFREANIHQTHISFDNATSPPAGTVKAIYTTSAAMVFNMPNGIGFSWTINNSKWMGIDPTVGISIGTTTLQPVGFYGTTPVAQQTVASDTLAELYIAMRALGLIA